ncbi:hypothetical protein [Pseudoglutamicibacter cumminsii]|uniref:hypothetical protein n=1 Tax=Pseudoglutamicibacter cumminsii TaxID=156979 RepID=UPI0021A5B66C|nr:hypothetical protein [Pseudoglutamicibacter cumminsii]MCT1685618.1 hypothetical protein [Pseudoglutamicibacter cumminsii]
MSYDEHSEKNNDLGGIPMFRGIDLPEAYRFPSYHPPAVSRETLQEWFSPARLSRYRIEPVDTWYVWNTRISKAFLEDISHVEVLLRNFIDVRLRAAAGIRCWWDSPKYQIRGFRNNVRKAKNRLKQAGLEATPDQIVPSLSLDNWRFLLTQRLEATVWKSLTDLRNGGMPHYPGRSRSDFEANVELIRKVRNRASHQEPLVNVDLDQQADTRNLVTYITAIDTVARNISPAAADWIAAYSRVVDVITQRPTPQEK